MAIVDNAFREWIADFKATNPGVADSRAILDTAQYAFAAGRKAQRRDDAARQPVESEENVAADTYWTLVEMIEPHVQREGINPDGALPASVHDSVAILLAHWLRTRQPVGWQPMESAPKDGTVVLGLLEGSDIPQSIRFRDGWEIAWDGYRIPAHDGPLRWAPLYAATPAQQPAQVYLDGLDRALGEAIDQRDRYHEMADDLAGHIAAITGVDIGEHSSANCPWQNAIEAAEEYKPAQAVEMSPEFTDTARAAIAWVLWHHQGGSSPVGQPLRFALGMGQHDRMTDQQIAEAKRFAAWANATTEDFHQRAPAQAVDLGGNEGYGTRYVPPVQAFDPGQFRESVERLKDDALHERDPGTAVNAYNRVLALIDGKAVGNG